MANKKNNKSRNCSKIPDDDEGVEEAGEARLILRLQQQQHNTNKPTSTKKMPPATAPIIIARLSSSFLPPGNPTYRKTTAKISKYSSSKI